MATVTAPPPPGLTSTQQGAKRRKEGVGRLAGLLLAPTFLVLALVVGYPVVAAFRLAFFAERGVDPVTGFVEDGEVFVGFDNFIGLFSGPGSDRFINAFVNTTTFTIASVSIEVVVGVIMALIMNKAFRGRGLIRASILVPWAIPTAISALLWRWIFQVDGVANSILGREILWSADDFASWGAVVIADTWKTAPFIGLLVLAGLQIIPGEVYEAAKVDGSSPWSTFWRITLPLVRPALVVAVLFRLLDVLRMFDLPYVLVGPNKPAVETISMLAFEEAITNNRLGPAAAYATVLFVYIALVAYVFVRVLGADLISSRTGRGGK